MLHNPCKGLLDYRRRFILGFSFVFKQFALLCLVINFINNIFDPVVLFRRTSGDSTSVSLLSLGDPRILFVRGPNISPNVCNGQFYGIGTIFSQSTFLSTVDVPVYEINLPIDLVVFVLIFWYCAY